MNIDFYQNYCMENTARWWCPAIEIISTLIIAIFLIVIVYLIWKFSSKKHIKSLVESNK